MIRSCRLATIITILALAVSCAGEDDPHAGVETGDDNEVVDALFAHWNGPGSPGCALAVAENGALVYSRGYGYANLDYDIPITPQTIFDVASVTKQKRTLEQEEGHFSEPGLKLPKQVLSN